MEPILIDTGLRFLDPGSDGRSMTVMICSQEQGNEPWYSHFFAEFEGTDAICPSCDQKHKVYSLVDALEGGWLQVPADCDDGGLYNGFTITTRQLVVAAIQFLREPRAVPQRPSRVSTAGAGRAS